MPNRSRKTAPAARARSTPQKTAPARPWSPDPEERVFAPVAAPVIAPPPRRAAPAPTTSEPPFDEAGYLRLNPDVRAAVEQGLIASGQEHYERFGRDEGRPVPGTPREARNVLVHSVANPTATEPPAGAIRCGVDAVLVAPGSGLMVVGWIDDTTHPLQCIRIVGPNWRVVLDANRIMRVRRQDAEQVLQGRSGVAYGFVGFVHFDEPCAVAGELVVELWKEGGYWTALKCPATVFEAASLRNAALSQIARADHFGSPTIEAMSCLEGGIGDELVRFNHAITRQVTSHPYIERFGPAPRGPLRGSIVVCLYGKPEFLFLQHCLFAGLPGIEDYEFIYVSNSPELSERLLRESRSAAQIYGLPSSVVILPGNAGFGAANNVAARFARSDRIMAVNPDVFPHDPAWARHHTELLVSAPREQTRIFGTTLFYDDGTLMHGGMYFETDTGLSLASGQPEPRRVCRTEHYGKGAPPQGTRYRDPRPVPAVTGAFISAERAWFEKLGGFTEDFVFGHYEDADLCLKSLAAGAPAWLHDLPLWHLEGKGSTRQLPHEGGSILNRWLFTRTWGKALEDGLLGPHPTHPAMNPPAGTAHTLSRPDESPRRAAERPPGSARPAGKTAAKTAGKAARRGAKVASKGGRK